MTSYFFDGTSSYNFQNNACHVRTGYKTSVQVETIYYLVSENCETD